jgi:hypothetical protein
MPEEGGHIRSPIVGPGLSGTVRKPMRPSALPLNQEGGFTPSAGLIVPLPGHHQPPDLSAISRLAVSNCCWFSIFIRAVFQTPISSLGGGATKPTDELATKGGGKVRHQNRQVEQTPDGRQIGIALSRDLAPLGSGFTFVGEGGVILATRRKCDGSLIIPGLQTMCTIRFG